MTDVSDENLGSKDLDGLHQSIRSRNLIAVTGTGFSCLASGDPLSDGHHVATWPGLLDELKTSREHFNAAGVEVAVFKHLHGKYT